MMNTKIPVLRIRPFILRLAIGWLLVALGLFIAIVLAQKETIREIARSEAGASLENDLLYRSWNATHGGVYVPVTAETQPNPYLNVAEREINTPAGRLLTLMNPIYMTRQVHEWGDAQFERRSHITSLNPINPANVADEWEKRALQAFEAGSSEVSSVEMLDNEKYMRLMRPLLVEERCLKCHAQQGYQVGDIRGGLSVSIPMSRYAAIDRRSFAALAVGYGALSLLGLVALYGVYRPLKRYILEREQVITAVEESKLKVEMITQTTRDGFCLANVRGELLEVNNVLCQLLGYSREELLQMHIGHLDARFTPEEIAARLERLVSEGAGLEETVHRRKDGSLLDVEITASRLPGEGNRFFAFVRDITARKRVESELRESEERYRTLVDLAPEGIVIHQDGQIVYVNRVAVHLVGGRCPQDLLGKPVLKFVHPAYLGIASVRVNRALAEGGFLPPEEEVFLRLDGSPIEVEAASAAITYQGKVSMITIARDITERKRVERELRESEERYRTLVDVAPEGIAVNQDGRLVYVNRASVQLLRAKGPEELLGTSVLERVHPDYHDIAIERTHRVLSGENVLTPREEIFLRMDGSFVDVEIAAAAITYQGKPSILIVARDITERKRVDRELRESEERYRKLVDLAPEGIVVHRAGRLVYANQAALNLVGAKSPDELLGTAMIERVHPDYRKMVAERVSQALAESKNLPVLEEVFLRLDGSPISVSVAAAPISYQGENSMLTIVHDITDRKQAEEVLRTALAEKETLLRELYHRTKNNMQVICALMEIQASTLPDERLRAVLDEMQNRIRSMALVHQKLYQTQNLSYINLGEYVHELAQLLLDSYRISPDQIQLFVEVPQEVFVSIDTAIPCGLILNELISNAFLHAFPAGRKGEIWARANRIEGGEIEIRVGDNGVGFLDGFNVGQSSTLGLMTVQALAHQLSGTVTFDGNQGVNCLIRFRDNLYQERI